MSGESHERTFQSREIIWNTFEAMARELDVPIDDLVNEAMAAYARVRGYAVPDEDDGVGRSSFDPASEPTPRRGSFSRSSLDRRDPMEETYDAHDLSPLDRSYFPARAPGDDFEDDDLARTASRAALQRPPPRPPSARGPLPAALARPPGPAHGSWPAPTPQTIEPYTARPPIPSGPPPLPRRSAAPASQPTRELATSRRLVLTYQGRTYGVEKERFLIGRSKTQSDLRLDDPNVSRQHAAVERVGSAWYIVDLGSTNGVHVAGERVARRALSDGDVIVITSHEIFCSVR